MDKKEAEQAFIDAALSLANETCAHAFVCPVPNTTPKLYVAMGEADQIKNLLRLSIETSAAETNPRQEKGSSGQKTTWEKSDERIKRLMHSVGMSNSVSLFLAFKQLETEVLHAKEQ